MTDSKNSGLGKKHGVLLLKIFSEDIMIPEFYKVLFEKMDRTDNAVRDIIKHVENTNGMKLKFIQERIKRASVNTFLINLINYSVSKGITKLCRIYEFTDHDIQTMIPNHFSSPDSFLVVGCPDSTDIDTIVFVREQDCYMGKTKELTDESISQIREQLRDLKYDVDNRELDINIVYVNPKTRMITASSKAGTETQNIINATHMLHKQVMTECMTDSGLQTMPLGMYLHPVVNIKFTDKEVLDKLRAFAKYVLDYAEHISRDYALFRPIRLDLYTQGGDQMMRFMEGITKYIVCDPVEVKRLDLDMIKYHDRFKSMTMKLLQILLHDRCNDTAYVKADLAKTVHRIFSLESDEVRTRYEAGALWLLFRGHRGSFCPELFPTLLEHYILIVNECLARTEIEPCIFREDDILIAQKEQNIVTALNDRMLSLFVESPEIFTEEFEKLWIEHHGSGTEINSQFKIACSDEKEFYNTYKNFDPDVLHVFKQCFIFVPQRSPEWLDMLSNRFVCGNNGGTIDNSTFQGRYNLIRGAIIELFAMHLFDPTLHAGLRGFKKWSLGFIVEKNATGSKGFAPDMILISDDADQDHGTPEFILIEIKGLKCSRKNADYYRGLHLATKQIGSGRDILSQFVSQDKLKIQRGIIILCCVENQQFMMEVHHVDL